MRTPKASLTRRGHSFRRDVDGATAEKTDLKLTRTPKGTPPLNPGSQTRSTRSPPARTPAVNQDRMTTTTEAPPPFTGGATPASAGLHKLAVLTGQVDVNPLSAVDFNRYVEGKNNRSLYGAIVRDLEKTFGVKVNHAYGKYNEAEPGVLRTGEKSLDELLSKFDSAEDKKAMATFVIAHEYFHVFLKHPDIALDGKSPKGFEILDRSGYRPMFELQVDYLAARYLQSRGLSLAPVTDTFTTPGEFEASRDYPSGEHRAAVVESAAQEDFRKDLFTNGIVDCIAFLDWLASDTPFGR